LKGVEVTINVASVNSNNLSELSGGLPVCALSQFFEKLEPLF